MKIYQVGPDLPYDLDENDERFEWVVFWYENEGYDGSGEAIGLCKQDGLLYIKNLEHCSCYGPMDAGLESGDKITIEEFMKHKESVHDYEAMAETKEKVIELLQWAAPVFTERFDFLD